MVDSLYNWDKPGNFEQMTVHFAEVGLNEQLVEAVKELDTIPDPGDAVSALGNFVALAIAKQDLMTLRCKEERPEYNWRVIAGEVIEENLDENSEARRLVAGLIADEELAECAAVIAETRYPLQSAGEMPGCIARGYDIN
jgi:hypothetical protein